MKVAFSVVLDPFGFDYIEKYLILCSAEEIYIGLGQHECEQLMTELSL